MNTKKVISGLAVGTRFFLAVVFIMYGVVKLVGGQFYYGDWVMDKKTVDGTSLVWAFYGYSWFYGHVIGLFELLPALMLLWRRTATLGASALFAVSLNITLLDFAYHYPSVKYMALIYTILCGLLMVYDRKKLMFVFWGSEEIDQIAVEVAKKRTDAGKAKKTVSKAAIAALIFLGLPLIAFALNLLGTGLKPGPEGEAALYLVRQGWQKDGIQFVSSRYTGFYGIGRTADIRFEVKGTNPPKKLDVQATLANGFARWHIERVIEDPPSKP